jgi:hypothetical protein
MSGINTGKVITGGLVAGVVFNIMDFIWNLVLAAGYVANSTRLGLDPAAMATAPVIASWAIVDLVMGLLVVFVYASIRPRFGPGPKTASIAGLIPYLAVTLVLFGFSKMQYLEMGLYLKASALQLVGILIGANVGAWMYKEG